jgi:uncharacterized small protein (DUF1192 family)
VIIDLENALAVARDPGGRSRDELVVSAAYLASEVEKLQTDNARLLAELARQKPVVDAAMALFSCGTPNVWARVSDILDVGLAYMQDDEHEEDEP